MAIPNNLRGIINGKKRKLSDEQIDQLAKELVEFADKEDSYMIETFINQKRILPFTYHQYIDTNENLKDAHIYAMSKFRERWTLRGAFKDSEFREGFSKFYLACHHNMIEKTAVQNDTQITINIKDSPES